jgi:hypothetical protein
MFGARLIRSGTKKGYLMRDLRITRARLASLLVVVCTGVLGMVFPAVGQAGVGCSNLSLHAAYGFTNTGVLLQNGARLDVASVGRLVYDGQGRVSGTGTLSLNGLVIDGTLAGTYNVNADCTGSDQLTFTPLNPGNPLLPPFHDTFVIVDKGLKVRLIDTDPGAVVTGTADVQ